MTEVVTVADVYEEIDNNEHILSQKGEASDYWGKCYDFWWEVKDKNITELSDKQMRWLDKIQEGLTE